MPKVSDYISKIVGHISSNHTAFHESKIAGKDILAATTTTLPENQRFAMIRDNVHLTLDEFEAEVTHNSPLYTMTNDATQEIIIRTRERNAYAPGSESVSGTAFQVESEIPDGQFLPDDAVLESGYGGLAEGTVTGAAINSGYDKDGPFLHIEDESADARVYKGGSPAKKIHHTDWEVDIFNDDRFEWSPDQYALFRWVFDLYGVGNYTLFARISDIDGTAQYVKIVTVGFRGEPNGEVFDMPVSTRVETAGTAVEWSVGPVSFHNLVSGEPPFRNKTAVYRQTPVTDASFGNTAADVLRVYRLHPDRVEALTHVTRISASAPADYRAEMREVHPDFLTWPDGFDEHDPANWEAPDNQRVSDTSVQEAKTDPGTVTIATFTDEDGKAKMRGKQDAVAIAEGGGGSEKSGQGEAADETTMSELDYVVLLGRIVGNNDPNFEIVNWRQRW